MCDETTRANGGRPAAPAGWSEADARAAGLSETMTEIATDDGACEAFFVHPATGQHPAILFWPDGVALRETMQAMARRLAAQGFAVLAPNQYYRSSCLPVAVDFDTWRTSEGLASMMAHIHLLTPDAVARDAQTFLGWLDRQAAVDGARGAGTQGYCAGGSMAVRTAATVPDRIAAAASFHGGQLVTDKVDSPHRLLEKARAAFLIAIARDDDARAPTDKDELRKAADAAGRPAEIEVYAADHSWCVADAPAYDDAEAERAFARLMALYAKL
jgi:carboxymethylenebutenolidase